MAAFPLKPLSEISSIFSGYAFKSKDMISDGDIPIIKIANIHNRIVSPTCITSIPKDLYNEKLEKYILKPDDVLIAMTGAGSVGNIGKMRRVDKTFFVNQRVGIIRTNSKLADPEFIYQVLSNKEVENKYYQLGLGAGQPNLSPTMIGGHQIPFPPLPTQRRIADILSAYDNLIENNTRRIRILEQMAQAIYQEWFGKVNKASLPKGWEVRKLSKLVDTQYGYTESTATEEVGPKYLRGMDINKSSFIQWSEVPFCPISDEDLPKYKLNVGDIVIIRMADPGKVGIVEKEVNAVFASYLIRLTIISPKLSPYFLFYFLLSDKYQGYITGASTGTTRMSASAGVITDTEIVIPSQEIRQRFEEQITDIRKLLNNLLNRNANLRQTRDLLLPRLVSGEIEVEGQANA